MIWISSKIWTKSIIHYSSRIKYLLPTSISFFFNYRFYVSFFLQKIIWWMKVLCYSINKQWNSNLISNEYNEDDHILTIFFKNSYFFPNDWTHSFCFFFMADQFYRFFFRCTISLLIWKVHLRGGHRMHQWTSDESKKRNKFNHQNNIWNDKGSSKKLHISVHIKKKNCLISWLYKKTSFLFIFRQYLKLFILKTLISCFKLTIYQAVPEVKFKTWQQ